VTAEPAPDPLEGQWADVHLIEDAVYGSVDYAIWTSTGGATGCTLCKHKTFAQRVAAGGHHIDCAREMARDEGARSVKYGMSCGDLMARLAEVVADPRLGQWKQHLDWWADHS
jgi:hypothetical protein